MCEPLHKRMLRDMFGWKWPSSSGEEVFMNFVNLCLLFISHFCKGHDLSFEQTWTNPCTQGYIVIISSFLRTRSFFWTNMNPLYQKMLCSKFVLNWANWASDSGEEVFFNFANVLSLCCNRTVKSQPTTVIHRCYCIAFRSVGWQPLITRTMIPWKCMRWLNKSPMGHIADLLLSPLGKGLNSDPPRMLWAKVC